MDDNDHFCPPSQPELYCPYCDTKVIPGSEFCRSCRRTFADPPVKATGVPVQSSIGEYRKPWLAALLSVPVPGLGQWYNGDTIKGLGFLAAIVLVLFIIPGSLPVDNRIVAGLIIGTAVFEAFFSSQRINRLQKSFVKMSVLFWPAIAFLTLVGVIAIAGVLAPHPTAHGATLVAGVIADTKYPEYSVPVYNTALAYAPNDTEIVLDKVQVMYAIGKTGEARAELDTVMETNPNLTAPIVMKGDLYFADGKFRESIECYDDALAIDSKDAAIFIRKGDAYLAISMIEMKKMRGQFRQLTAADQELSAGPGTEEIDAFRSTESYREAVKAYNEAIKINPLLSAEISGRILASTQTLVENYQGILDDIGKNTTAAM